VVREFETALRSYNPNPSILLLAQCLVVGVLATKYVSSIVLFGHAVLGNKKKPWIIGEAIIAVLR
jgi:uncharacterized membrane protein